MKDRKIIAIVGPTASGKTGIGVKLARELNGEIISADSRQVYRGLDIGSGKECFADVKQRLIDVADPGEKFTLFDWLKLSRLAIDDIFSRGKVPIIVGGTGLYVQGLVEGFTLEPILNSQFSILNQISDRKTMRSMTIEQLRAMLSTLYPQGYPQVDENNPRRLIRAIERAQEGLKPIKIKPNFGSLQIGIDLPREELYKKIDDRVESRFSAGMLEEVIGLILSGVDANWLIKLGLEYRIIAKFVIQHSPVLQKSRFSSLSFCHPRAGNAMTRGSSGKFSSPLLQDSRLHGNGKKINEAVQIADDLRQLSEYGAMEQELKYKIHAFARRQLTWFRRFPEIKWCPDYNCALKKASNFLKG